MKQQPLSTINEVKLTVQEAYSEQDWLVIVLKDDGWVDSNMWVAGVQEAILTINGVIIVVRQNMNATPPHRIKVDFRLQDEHTGWWETHTELRQPTAEDIRRELVLLGNHTGIQISRDIAEDSGYIR